MTSQAQLITNQQKNIKQSVHPQTGLQIFFDPATHTYRDERDQHYHSVTQVIKSAFPRFDAPTHAARVAQREGVTTESILLKWKEKARAGTRIHETAEAAVLKRDPPHIPESEQERTNFSAIWQYINKMRSEMGFEFVAAEPIVFSPTLGVAGQVDLIARRDDMIWILDYKTNEEIRRDNRYNSFGLWPLSNNVTGLSIPDNNFSHYALQLAIYQTILELEGYFPPLKYGRAILHIRDGKVEVIPTPEMRIEVIGALLAPYVNTPFSIANK